MRLKGSCICILTLWKTEIQIWVGMSRNSDFLHTSNNFDILVISYDFIWLILAQHQRRSCCSPKGCSGSDLTAREQGHSEGSVVQGT